MARHPKKKSAASMASWWPASLGPPPSDEETERLRAISAAYGAEKIRFNRFFVGVEMVEADGGERLLVLTPYFLLLAVADLALHKLLPEHPDARVWWDVVTLDTADWLGARRVARYADQVAAEVEALAKWRKSLQ